MQNPRFVVLTGHLSNYPLSDLVGILRHQKKTGRLLIEYPKGPASFFFQEGELIDARMNDLSGLQAICVALAQPEAAFNFNPLIPATRRSIEPSLQRAVSELFGCWDESALQIETMAVAQPVFAARPEPLALPPAPPSSALRQRPMLFMAAAVLVGVGLSTVVAITGAFNTNPPSVAAAEAPRINPPNSLPPVSLAENTELSKRVVNTARSNRRMTRAELPVEKNEKRESTKEPIKVTMQIENGRVLNASIANHKPGRENYEALALRIARQRRYAATANGGQTVTITVSPED